MKTLLLLILSISLGLRLQGLSSPLFISQPADTATVAQVTPTPTPSDDQVIMEIVKVFAKEDRHTIKKIIDIAYGESGLRWNAHHVNTNGSEDFGVFQINSVHTKRFGSEFKTDYKVNIQVAYALFERQGFAPWVVARRLGYAL